MGLKPSELESKLRAAIETTVAERKLASIPDPLRDISRPYILLFIENPAAVHFKTLDENQTHQSDNTDEHKCPFSWNFADLD